MRKLILLLLFFGAPTVAMGEVSTRVCLADSNTPLELADPNVPFVYRDIMVGTNLTIIVDSNVAEFWTGSLAIADANMDYGVLSARDFNEITYDWQGSHFGAAGEGARVWDWEEINIDGFDLYTDEDIEYITAGSWFIIDYTATSVGYCNVWFYQNFQPDYYLMFSHVRTRDFNKDTKVDFADFALLVSFWKATGCSEPNWCEGTDLDTNGKVDSNDLILFADYWLERTE